MIRDEVIAGVPGYDGPAGEIHDRDVLTEYGKFLRSLVNLTDLRPLRVAVDAGNGMAGHTAPAVFGPIDALTVLPLYFELDGSFPNHEANPLDPANLVDLQRFVVDSGADIARSMSRPLIITTWPWPSAPSRFSAGTSKPSKPSSYSFMPR